MPKKIKEITAKAFIAEGERRFGPDKKTWQFKCPVCKTPQSANDFVDAGVRPDDIQKYIGFSCIGRHTGGKTDFNSKKGSGGKGCDYTLGGLLRLNIIAIKSSDGKSHPHFDLAAATKEAAQ